MELVPLCRQLPSSNGSAHQTKADWGRRHHRAALKCSGNTFRKNYWRQTDSSGLAGTQCNRPQTSTKQTLEESMPNQSSCRTGPLPFTPLFTAVQRAVKCEISFGKSLLDLGLDKTGQTEGEIPNTFHSPAEAYVPPAPYRYKLLHIYFFPVLHYLEGATTESRNTPSITWQTGTVVFWKCSAHASFKTEPWYP